MHLLAEDSLVGLDVGVNLREGVADGVVGEGGCIGVVDPIRLVVAAHSLVVSRGIVTELGKYIGSVAEGEGSQVGAV